MAGEGQDKPFGRIIRRRIPGRAAILEYDSEETVSPGLDDRPGRNPQDNSAAGPFRRALLEPSDPPDSARHSNATLIPESLDFPFESRLYSKTHAVIKNSITRLYRGKT